MDYLSVFLTILAAAIGIFMVLRKFRFYQENKEIDSSLSCSSPPSSLSPSPVTPSSSSHNWTQDVFPSFRGEDVRRDFLSHIQKEFRRKGIKPFNDNGIKRGESICPELIREIRGSKIAIVLLSRNYASSKWCLDELVEIMKCREELGQTVLAIFYKVDPSDVKKLAGDFGKVFRKTCVGKTKEVIKGWRQALVKVATIAGYDSSNRDNEAAMIERIATDVSSELIHSVPTSDFDGFVGMRAHMEKMEPLLLLGSNEVRMIGIWGPSGIGKSTIARVLYSQYFHQFQLSVFMENIKRRYPRPYYDEYSAKLQLQKEFLSQLINQEDIKIHHLGVAQDRLKDKRVLVVLDDVDHLVQLDAMAKETLWFGPGSRIIITTQDKKLLNAHRINHIYEVEFPSPDEALEIFCVYAFGQKSPYDSFEYLAREVTQLAGSLPLGLRIMGSYFKGMSKHEWTKALPRLRASLDGETESILKFSYDVLCEEDKALFLYISCFFNGEPIKKVETYLGETFSDVEGSLRVLVEKSLISTSLGYIDMHTLLSRLGREIVRKQSINEPGQRQFLFDAKDICQVLCNDSVGSRSVIGIDLKSSELGKELKINSGAFEKMSNAQFLRLKISHALVESVNYLPPKVRLLDWDGFPMTCLPSNFNPESLLQIKMRNSNLERLWEGIKMIRNLKWMDLSKSSNLKELPDLSTATNLQKLYLSFCSSLVELPSSIGNAINLQKLDLSYCSSLVELPSSIGNAINLQKLNLSYCSSLAELPSSFIGNAVNFEILDLSYCSSLVRLRSSFGNAINLKGLNLSECTSLVELPSSIGNMTSLEILYLKGCSSLVELPSSIGNMTNLKRLSLKGCSSLVELPSSIGNITNLKRLSLNGCLTLVELPSSIGNMTNLKKLNLYGCSSLVLLLSFIGNLNLKKLNLSGCSSLVELPSSIGNMNKLKKLNLNGCSSLVELPSSIGNLTKLEELHLDGCSSLLELPSSLGNLHNLQALRLRSCSKLNALPISLNMKSLYELDLTDCSLLKSFPEISTNISVLKLNGTGIEEIPPLIKSWSCLYSLHMSYCDNLKKSQYAFDRITELHLTDTRLQEIGPWVKEMSRLHKLVIKGCTKLVSLPQLPNSLAILDAENCESLERLDCSFYMTKFFNLNFVNCFKLNQEARDLIIKTSTRDIAVFPGEKVPTYFTYRATGSSLSMKSNRFDTHFPMYSRFKACFLLVKKVDGEAGDLNMTEISYYIEDKWRTKHLESGFSLSSKEHLFVFEFEEIVSSTELVFEFKVDNEKLEIQECGVRPLENLEVNES